MRAADEARFATVAAAQQPALRRSAYLLCGDWHLADDLVQKALLKLYLAWPLRDDGAAPAWLTRTLSRAFVDESRRPWRRREVAAPQLPDTAARETASSDDELLGMLATLPRQQRVCMVLRFLEDYSIEQTADALGLSVGTVKGYTSRGLATLRTSLTDTVPTKGPHP